MSSRGAEASRRKPWLAAILNLLWPGVGYLYAGRGRLGLILLLLAPLLMAGVTVLPFLIPVRVANIVIPAVLLLGLPALFAWGAARAAARLTPDDSRPVFSRWYVCLAAAIFSGALNVAWGPTAYVRGLVCQGHAMEPTVLPGDRVWVSKATNGWRNAGLPDAKRGDVIIFRYPRDRSVLFIKRLIGLPAETVELRGKEVLINGAPLNEPYAHFLLASRRNWGPRVVPAAGYFVLGDNRDVSSDSPTWGFVPQDHLVGLARVVFWSSDPQDGRVRWERIGSRLQ